MEGLDSSLKTESNYRVPLEMEDILAIPEGRPYFQFLT